MKKLAFAMLIVFTTFTFVSSDKKGVLNPGFQPVKVQSAILNGNAGQIVPITVGRGNLAQADGKVSF